MVETYLLLQTVLLKILAKCCPNLARDAQKRGCMALGSCTYLVTSPFKMKLSLWIIHHDITEGQRGHRHSLTYCCNAYSSLNFFVLFQLSLLSSPTFSLSLRPRGSSHSCLNPTAVMYDGWIPWEWQPTHFLLLMIIEALTQNLHTGCDLQSKSKNICTSKDVWTRHFKEQSTTWNINK